ncbi:MAG: hypothetical protein JW847_02910 [Candidatus Omnitrophica bacterium]|nr:hypothetical protein [Candidatus Omnitrophota bacterium]
MRTKVGLWIDHEKAVVVAMTPRGEEMLVIQSKVEKQRGRFAGIRSTTPYEAQQVSADDSRQRKLTGKLNIYYDAVIASIRGAGVILIFGPSEAKGELKKRLTRASLGDRIVAIETVGRITDRQIAAKVREYFRVNSASEQEWQLRGRTNKKSRRPFK